jgi:RND superfamily putative drug exporter
VFSAWGRLVYRHRRIVAIATLVLALGSLVFAAQAASRLSTGGWLVSGSESARVQDRLQQDFGQTGSSLLVLFRTADGGPATDPATVAAIGRSLEGVAAHPDVAGVHRWTPERPDPGLISTDGTATYAVVALEVTEEASIDLVDELRAAIAPQPEVTFSLTGYGPLAQDSNHQSEEDLQRAELVSLPLALLILIVVFASVVAAGMPLLVAGLAIPSTLGLIHLVSTQLEMSIYVLNVATMLGLALAIDYSLFIVSRFREELARGRSTGDAVERAIATSGKAVVFSGVAVAIGLLGLLFFESPAISSMGVGGSIVVICSVFFAVTFLPAALGMLGPRVNALSLASLGTRLRARRAGASGPAGWRERTAGDSWWARVARAVMAHPVRVLIPTLALLLLAGAPYLSLQQAVPDAAVLPAGLESRDAYVALDREFPPGETAPYVVLAQVDGDPTAPPNALALARYAEAVAALPGVEAVEGPFSGLTAADGSPLDPEGVRDLYALPEAQRPPELAAALAALEDAYIRGSTVRMDAVSSLAPVSDAAGDLAEAMRAIRVDGVTEAQVGGMAATSRDTISSMQSRTPWAVGTTLLVIGVVLYLLFGSLVLPIKAVLMTLLSITASFGALVWIFQEGHLSELLGFEPLGYTVAGIPIIMFAVLIGLSMDYEVLLLSRIKEFRDAGLPNDEAVAAGLQKSGRIITSAALVIVIVFAGFAAGQLLVIKQTGVGLAVTVAVDATLVRLLLVPATMTVLGEWNWWAPAPLRRLHDRLGLQEG